LERETNKIIKDDRRARRASLRQRSTVTVEGVSRGRTPRRLATTLCEKQLTPTKRDRRSPVTVERSKTTDERVSPRRARDGRARW